MLQLKKTLRAPLAFALAASLLSGAPASGISGKPAAAFAAETAEPVTLVIATATGDGGAVTNPDFYTALDAYNAAGEEPPLGQDDRFKIEFAEELKTAGVVVGDAAFREMAWIAAVDLKGVKSIGGGAFWGTALEEVTIPDSVTSIGALLFGNIDALETITFEGDAPEITPRNIDLLDRRWICDLGVEIIVPDDAAGYFDPAYFGGRPNDWTSFAYKIKGGYAEQLEIAKGAVEAAAYIVPAGAVETEATEMARDRVNAAIAGLKPVNNTTATVSAITITSGSESVNVALALQDENDTAVITVAFSDAETGKVLDAAERAIRMDEETPTIYTIPLSEQGGAATKEAWLRARVNESVAKNAEEAAKAVTDGAGDAEIQYVLTSGGVTATVTFAEAIPPGESEAYDVTLSYGGEEKVFSITAALEAADEIQAMRAANAALAAETFAIPRDRQGTPEDKIEWLETEALAVVTGAVSGFSLEPPGIEVTISYNQGVEPPRHRYEATLKYKELKTEPPIRLEALYAEETPNAAIDYAAEKLTGLAPGAAYAINGASAEADADGDYGITALIPAAGGGPLSLSIARKAGGPDKSDSLAQDDLSLPARPAAPTPGKTDCGTAANNDGTITNVTAAMEYQKAGDANWTAITGATVTGLANGTYSARVKAVENESFKSAETTVTIAPFVPDVPPTYAISASTLSSFGSLPAPYTPPEARTVTVTNTGTGLVTLTQPTASKYDIGTLSTTTLAAKDATATFTVRPKAGLAEGTHDETITVGGSGGAGATVLARFTVSEDTGAAYAITVSENNSAYGTARADSARAANGERVNLTASARSGYAFESWEVRSGGAAINNPDARDAWFTMPAGDVSVRANFRQVSGVTYDIIMSVNYTAYGRVSAPREAEDGERVDIRAIPRSGFEFDQWEVISPRRGVTINNRNSEETRFTMPDDDVEITARFKRAEETDNRPAGSAISWSAANTSAASASANMSIWAAAEVKKAGELGLIPDSLRNADYRMPVTRVEFAGIAVKVFERLAGTTVHPTAANPFADTRDADALKALNAGIMIGSSSSTFSPYALLDREQCATALTRAFKRAAFSGWTLTSDASYPLSYQRPAPFADDADISDWAKESVYFMAASGLITGVGNNRFAPRATAASGEAAVYMTATREQALAIAVRMVENLK